MDQLWYTLALCIIKRGDVLYLLEELQGPGLFRAYALPLSADRDESAMPEAEVAGRKTQN